MQFAPKCSWMLVVPSSRQDPRPEQICALIDDTQTHAKDPAAQQDAKGHGRWTLKFYAASLTDKHRTVADQPADRGAPGTGFGFIGSRPSRCNFLRASLRARRTASAFSRARFSEGFS